MLPVQSGLTCAGPTLFTSWVTMEPPRLRVPVPLHCPFLAALALANKVAGSSGAFAAAEIYPLHVTTYVPAIPLAVQASCAFANTLRPRPRPARRAKQTSIRLNISFSPLREILGEQRFRDARPECPVESRKRFTIVGFLLHESSFGHRGLLVLFLAMIPAWHSRATVCMCQSPRPQCSGGDLRVIYETLCIVVIKLLGDPISQ